MIAHRFTNIDITEVTIKNYKLNIILNLYKLQVEMFIPPEGHLMMVFEKIPRKCKNL